MAKRKARAGGKFSGTHTSLIETAAHLLDGAYNTAAIKKIAPGVIKTTRSKSGGRQHAKLTAETWGIRIKVTDGSAHQEIFVYGSPITAIHTALAESARALNVTTTFTDRRDENRHH